MKQAGIPRKAKNGKAARAGRSQRGSSPKATPARKPFPIVGVGASAGGLEAFKELLQALPRDTGMAFVLVQHLDPDHASVLTQILTRATQLPVREVSNNTVVEPNHVYVIPPNSSMVISGGVLKLRPRRAAKAFRSIDPFLESLAEDQGERAIGVILSGTATDGTQGLEAIKAHDGITFVQDASAKYESMPRSAAAAGCVDFVLSPGEIAAELARIAQHPYVRGEKAAPPGWAPAPEAEPGLAGLKGERDGFKKILLLLRNHSGVDFSLYKTNTIHRRVTRRMVLNKLTSPEAYAQFLRRNVKELDALYADVLINVSSFFRNPEAFDALKQLVFPKLIRDRRPDPIRLWVPGCSSGQEAYSLAMAMNEYAGQSGTTLKLQMFATDLNEALLDKARAGLYPKALVQDVSAERLRRFFIEEEGGYRVTKTLRDSIVFARQNAFGDPPFSRLDLISCRNLMIYLESSLQQKILPTFHYALKPSGFLFLGASETVTPFAELFETVDRKHKIYTRKPGPTPALQMLAPPRLPGERKPAAPARTAAASGDSSTAGLNAQREADRIALNRYAPPGVLLNAGWQVLQFRGETSPYLKPPTGKANFNVLSMAREGLLLPLRSTLQKARREKKPVRRENIRISQNGHSREISLEVVPLTQLKESCLLVFFEEALDRPRIRPQRPESVPGAENLPQVPAEARPVALRQRATELERELAETRDFLQSLQEQYEAANEELQASNEEVTSANEELQSINEELETSKEELESANEELLTVNEEMGHRNQELGRLNSDLLNFQSAADMGIVLLGRDKSVRRFTSKGAAIFNLAPTDVGRSIGSIRHELDVPDLEEMLTGAIENLRESERETRDRSGRWYSLRVRPYRSVENTIDGAVLVVVDIDDLKRAAQEITEAREYAEEVLRTMRDLLVVLDGDLRVHSANNAFYETFHLTPEEVQGRQIYEVANGAWDVPRLRKLLEAVVAGKDAFANYEVTHEFSGVGRLNLLLNARQMRSPDGRASRVLLGIHNVTDRVKAEARVRLSELRFRRLFESGMDGVLLLDPSTERVVDINPAISALLGCSRDELVGKCLSDVGIFEGASVSKALLGQLRREGSVRQDGLVLVARSGERREVEFVANLYTENGTQIIQCNMRDVTERRLIMEALRQSELRHRALAENIPQLVWTSTAEGQCDYLSPSWAAYTGRPLVEQLGERWLEAFHLEDRARLQAAWRGATEHKQAFELECRLRKHDGEYRWFSLRAVALSDSSGRLARWFGTCTDIDDRKRASGILEETVFERTSELRQSVQELEAISYSLSHDLRAPLRAMRGFADLLLDGYAKELDATGKNYLERIARAAKRLDVMIQDVLNYSRVVRATAPLVPVPLERLVPEILQSYAEFRPPLAEIQVEGGLPTVSAHEGFLTQAISNLLLNAVKFVAPGVAPRVRIRADEVPEAALGPESGGGGTPGRVRLWIEDNGIGIDPENHERVFKMFERVHHERSYEGTGIGLAVVRKAIERLGGQVGFESTPGQGSRFWIELPRAQA